MKNKKTVVEAAMKEWDKAFLLGVEFGIKQAEKGNNVQMALHNAKSLLGTTCDTCPHCAKKRVLTRNPVTPREEKNTCDTCPHCAKKEF